MLVTSKIFTQSIQLPDKDGVSVIRYTLAHEKIGEGYSLVQGDYKDFQ